MTVKDHANGKIIILSKAFDSRAKILNIFNFLVFAVLAVALLALTIHSLELPLWFIIILIIANGTLVFIAFKFINKAVQSELLIVTKNDITIITKGFLNQQSTLYQNTFISNFTHIDKPSLTKHPLSGNGFDFLGFQTEQMVINELHGDKRLSFDYKGRTINFGENVYSWDFEELEILLYDITGNDFRYEDTFEKTFLKE